MGEGLYSRNQPCWGVDIYTEFNARICVKIRQHSKQLVTKHEP